MTAYTARGLELLSGTGRPYKSAVHAVIAPGDLPAMALAALGAGTLRLTVAAGFPDDAEVLCAGLLEDGRLAVRVGSDSYRHVGEGQKYPEVAARLEAL